MSVASTVRRRFARSVSSAAVGVTVVALVGAGGAVAGAQSVGGSLGRPTGGIVLPGVGTPYALQDAVVVVGDLGGELTDLRIDVDLPAGAAGPARAETARVDVTRQGSGSVVTTVVPVVADGGSYHLVVPGPVPSRSTVTVVLPAVTTGAPNGTVVADLRGPDASTQVGARLVGGTARLG